MKTGLSPECRIAGRIASDRMTAAERETANAAVRQGELIADVVIPAIAFIRLIAERVGRRVRELVRLSH